MNGRRDFLRIFGLSSAAIATVSTDKGAEFEKIEDHTQQPLKESFPPTSHGRKEILSYNPHYLGIVDGQLYSSLEIYEGDCVPAYSHKFFSYGMGPSGIEMLGGRYPNLNDTNLCSAFRLDAPECFAVKRIGLTFSPTCDPGDRSKLVESFTLSLWLGQKCYFRVPTADLFQVGEPDVKETNRLNPEFPTKYMHELELPVIIQTMQHFYVQLEGGIYFRPEHRMKMWAVLGGSHARGVQ